MQLEPGLYPNISHADYHALEYVSNSYLGRLDKVPANVKVKQEESAAFRFGRAFHINVLEPKLFDSQITVEPEDIDKRTKAGKIEYAAWLETASGKTVISADENQTIQAMTMAVYNHPFAKTIILEGRSEMSVIWRDEKSGLMCRCRPDRIPDGDHGVIVDVKTAASADIHSFTSSCIKYGYGRQAGMYIEGLNAVCNSKVDAFVFIVVEKEEPYRVEVYTLEDMFIDWGRKEFHRLLEIEMECREKKFYPHYKHAEIRTIYLPNWAA
ncbi:MAG: PD-(D/E)XK nuclease-like domain-containing protein [Dehalococcoidia bacterium]